MVSPRAALSELLLWRALAEALGVGRAGEGQAGLVGADRLLGLGQALSVGSFGGLESGLVGRKGLVGPGDQRLGLLDGGGGRPGREYDIGRRTAVVGAGKGEGALNLGLRLQRLALDVAV